MPSNPHETGPQDTPSQSGGSASSKSLQGPRSGLRRSGKAGRVDVVRGSSEGLAPREAIDEWLRFAQAQGHRLTTGQRKFARHIDRVETILEEERSLYEWCRHKGIGLSEK